MADIMRPRTLTPMRSLRREVDRLFNDFFPTVREEGGPDVFSPVWTPRMDMSETDSEYLVKLDLPGINKDDVTVNVEDGQLTVSGERSEEKKEEKENYLRMERSFGSFYRSVPLPTSADPEKVKADFKNGVLKIHIPKSEEKKPRRISIT